MADTFGNRPFGLREVDITPYSSAGVLGTRVDLPASMTLSFRPTKEEKELRGNDVVQEVVTYNKQVEWTLEAGGISLDALAVLTGGTVATAGVTPNATKTITAKGTDSESYFRIRGRAVNSSGASGTQVEILYCKVTSGPEGEFKDGEFYVTRCSGRGIPHPTSSETWKLVEQETAAALA